MSGGKLDTTCEACRSRAYEYRRGALDGETRQRIEAHLDRCANCRDYVERIEILIGAAQDHDPTEEAGDPDEMFAAISARIEDETAENDGGEPESSSSFFGPVGIAAAAAVAAVIIGVWLSSRPATDAGAEREETPVEGVADKTHDDQTDSPDRVDRKDERQAPEASSETDVLADLKPAKGGSESVTVFASDGAEWELSEGKELTVDLREGRLLVEFVPHDDRSLTVSAPGCDVRVVGTLFYVSAERDEPRVGVLAGRVEVRTEDKEPVVLGRGDEVDAQFETRPMPAPRRKALSSYADPEAHLERLAKRREEAEAGEVPERQERPPTRRKKQPPKEEPPEKESSPSAAATDEPGSGEEETSGGAADLRKLRVRADRAATEKRWQEAVKRYEKFLARATPDHPDAGPVHLDLANIFIHRLDRPAAAVPHLQKFVDRWPRDVATPSARRELCRITRELDQFEARCNP